MIIYTLFYVFIKRLSSSAPQCRTVHHSIGRCPISIVCTIIRKRARVQSTVLTSVNMNVNEHHVLHVCKWMFVKLKLLSECCHGNSGWAEIVLLCLLPWRLITVSSEMQRGGRCFLMQLTNMKPHFQLTFDPQWPPGFPGLSEQLHIVNKQKKIFYINT